MGLTSASYMMTMFSCLAGQNMEDVVIHCLQFCRMLRVVFAGSPNRDITVWTTTLWHSVVSAVYIHRIISLMRSIGAQSTARDLYFNYYCTETFIIPPMSTGDVITQSYDTLDRGKSLVALLECLTISTPIFGGISLQQTSPIAGEWRTEPALNTKTSLDVYLLYLQVLFEHFLLQINFNQGPGHADDRNSARVELHKVLRKVLELIERDPHFHSFRRDLFCNCPGQWPATPCKKSPRTVSTKISATMKTSIRESLDIGMLYFTFRLLAGILDKDIENCVQVDYEMYNAALTLAQLVDSFDFQHVKSKLWRSLFWVGVILFKMRYPGGKLPQTFLFEPSNDGQPRNGLNERWPSLPALYIDMVVHPHISREYF